MTGQNRLINKYSINVNALRNAQNAMSREFKTVLTLTLLHVPFGILFYRSSLLGIINCLAAFFLGLYWALNKRQKLEYVACVAAYLVGVEVLWRMAGVPIFWEFGKYGSALIMIVALIKRGHYKIPSLPLLFFASLIPSCILTLISYDMDDAKAKLSFNMSGPFCLFVSCWFFSYIKLNQLQLRRVFLSLIIPIVTVACATLLFTIANPDIEFNTESNAATSGGFGPNQVSSILGLGVFVSVTCFILFKNNSKYAFYFGAVSLLLAAQSIMTFSRGGIYAAVGALLIVGFFQFQNLFKALKRIIPVVLLGISFLLFIFPVLNNYTGGKLQERFEETDSTNRGEIAESDYQIFLDNPVLGVGVGAANEYRAKILNYRAGSHTEFARLVSEHGSLGIFSIFLFLLMSLLNLKKQKSSLGRALIGGTFAWCTLFMLNAGMRVAAPSFIFGLTFISLVSTVQFNSKKLRFINTIKRRRTAKDETESVLQNDNIEVSVK